MLGGIDCGTGEQGRPERVVGTEPDDRRSSAAGGGSEGRVAAARDGRTAAA
jgi:hypothetical protein